MSRLALPLLLALCGLLAAAVAPAQVTLDAPRGGWRHSGGEPAQALQQPPGLGL